MFGPLLLMVLATLGTLWLVRSAASQPPQTAAGLGGFLAASVLLGLLGAVLLTRGAWALAVPAAAGAIACGLVYQRRAGTAPRGQVSSSSLSTSEALDILGLAPGASADDVKAAHRRLIDQVHPDHGGTDYLAAQINAARDVLLKGTSQ